MNVFPHFTLPDLILIWGFVQLLDGAFRVVTRLLAEALASWWSK